MNVTRARVEDRIRFWRRVALRAFMTGVGAGAVSLALQEGVYWLQFVLFCVAAGSIVLVWVSVIAQAIYGSRLFKNRDRNFPEN